MSVTKMTGLRAVTLKQLVADGVMKYEGSAVVSMQDIRNKNIQFCGTVWTFADLVELYGFLKIKQSEGIYKISKVFDNDDTLKLFTNLVTMTVNNMQRYAQLSSKSVIHSYITRLYDVSKDVIMDEQIKTIAENLNNNIYKMLRLNNGRTDTTLMQVLRFAEWALDDKATDEEIKQIVGLFKSTETYHIYSTNKYIANHYNLLQMTTGIKSCMAKGSRHLRNGRRHYIPVDITLLKGTGYRVFDDNGTDTVFTPNVEGYENSDFRLYLLSRKAPSELLADEHYPFIARCIVSMKSGEPVAVCAYGIENAKSIFETKVKFEPSYPSGSKVRAFMRGMKGTVCYIAPYIDRNSSSISSVLGDEVLFDEIGRPYKWLYIGAYLDTKLNYTDQKIRFDHVYIDTGYWVYNYTYSHKAYCAIDNEEYNKSEMVWCDLLNAPVHVNYKVLIDNQHIVKLANVVKTLRYEKERIHSNCS